MKKRVDASPRGAYILGWEVGEIEKQVTNSGSDKGYLKNNNKAEKEFRE